MYYPRVLVNGILRGMNIELSDEQAKVLAGWIHDQFDDYRRGYRDCLGYWKGHGGIDSIEAVEELGEYREMMPVLQFAYRQLTGEDLLEIHGIEL